MWRSRMFWRLFGTFSSLVLCAMAILGVGIVRQVEQHQLQQIEDTLRAKAILLREVVRDLPSATSAALQERTQALRAELAIRITLVAADGRVLADTDEDPARMENHTDRPEIRAAWNQGFGKVTRYSTTTGETMMYVALRTSPDRLVSLVRVALPLDGVHQQLGVLQRIVWTAVLITGMAVLLLAFALARRITQPLKELTDGATRLGTGDYGHKVYVTNTDEIGHLAQTFNCMSEQLAIQFAQLAEDRLQLHAVLSGMVEGVVAIDADQRLLFANERAGQLLEFQLPSAVGRKFWEIVRNRPIQEAVQAALAGVDGRSEELSWNGPVARNLMLHVAPLAGPPRRGAVLVLHDLTNLRRLERLREEFVANVSHELKTPLAVIKAAVETLLDGAVDDPKHRGPFLETIAEQAERLHLLIMDMLSLARIEAGTETFDIQAIPLAAAVTACLERHRTRAEAKQQQLEPVPPPGTVMRPVCALADEEAVAQILDNLVDNALKYTPPGGYICVHWHGNGDHVSLEVTDTGIGIPDHDLPRIFERFYRVDRARSRELGGTGLGLSIVKHLVQALHGTISCRSHLGQGSTFTVRLPQAPLP